MISIRKNIHFALWQEIHRLPRFLVQRWQLLQLKRTVETAYRHVPMYRKLWQTQGVSPKDIKTIDDIVKLPIINKHTLRAYSFRETVNDGFASFPPNSYYWQQTSGSTGEPFRFILTPLQRIFGDMRYFYSSEYRFLLWRGVNLDKIYRHTKIAHIRITPHPHALQYLFIPISRIRNDHLASLLQIYEFAPDILRAPPTILVEFARIAKTLPAKDRKKIPCIVSYSEMLAPPQRLFVEDVLGGEVYDQYGFGEVGFVGVECTAHQGLHLYEESMLTEVVDDSGHPVEDGKSGRIVATSFYNDLMPFIRYDGGDYGTIIKEACPCGLTTRRLLVQGRTGAFITMGSKKMHHLEFEGILRYYGSSVLRYQIAKVGEKKIELRIIPGKTFSSIESRQLGEQFREKFAIDPEIKIVPDIPYTERGKNRVLVDET